MAESRSDDCGLRSELALRLIRLMAKPKQCECDGMMASCYVCIACFIVDGQAEVAHRQIESWESLAENDAAEAERDHISDASETMVPHKEGCACEFCITAVPAPRDAAETEGDESTAH